MRFVKLLFVSLLLPAAIGFAQPPGVASFSSSSASLGPVADAGSMAAQDQTTPPAGQVASAYSTPFSGLAIGVKVGLLGVGVEAATPLARTLNLRGGANFFSYNDTFTSDGIPYDATLRFRSGEMSLDWFPWAKGFHVSVGALIYNGNEITANALVPGGQTITLDDTDYLSSSADPVKGNGSLTFNKAAPKVTIGWGNMLPRSGRHFSVPFEAGFAYVGDPKVALNLSGSVCDTSGTYCRSIASDPTVQANITGQQEKIAKDAQPARFYPILSIGLAFNF